MCSTRTQPAVFGSAFQVSDFQPAYLQLEARGELRRRARLALEELRDCCACPRNCHVNRLESRAKICGTGRHAIVSNSFAHFGEEDCLRGSTGSGTIFFAMCNLRCVFCQNWDISQLGQGSECDAAGIADKMLALQAQGCHNINFVTPEHVVPQVIEAVALAVPRGLRLPIVYNTSAYDAPISLDLLDGIVDIYMPDFKFWHRQSARRFAKAKDYPERARAAILQMHRQVGDLRVDAHGVAKRGLLVRHLVMPDQHDETAAITKWLAESVSVDTFINIMDQYRPAHKTGEINHNGRPKYASIDRHPRRAEIEAAYAAARMAGLWRFDMRQA